MDIENTDLPVRLENSYNMENPNQVINIYEGNFTIKSTTYQIFLKGLIKVEWTPYINISFDGEVIEPLFTTKSEQEFIDETDNLFINNPDVLINNSFFAKSKITYISQTINNSIISGKLLGKSLIGDQTIDVDSLRFTIPNLKSFYGELVKRIVLGGHHIYQSRLVFNDDCHTIILDQRQNHDLLHEALEKQGGFLLFYNGEYKQNNLKKISFSDASDLVDCFSKYLTFINGSRTTTMFLEGILDNTTVWTDYTLHSVDNYQKVQSWSLEYNTEDLGNLWSNFNKLWSTDKEFLTSVIHWYVEANKSSEYTNGNLILVQTALELIYNWFVIEKEQLLYGNDADNISAANKIRLLLSKLNITSEIPKEFTSLQKTLNEKINGKITDLKDGPGIASFIRNCIIHSKTKNRDIVKLITEEAKSQSLQLCLWYVELSILKILSYKGKYYNRCSGELYREHGEEFVPWI